MIYKHHICVQSTVVTLFDRCERDNYRQRNTSRVIHL